MAILISAAGRHRQFSALGCLRRGSGVSLSAPRDRVGAPYGNNAGFTGSLLDRRQTLKTSGYHYRKPHKTG